jgi:hypothetical protein
VRIFRAHFTASALAQSPDPPSVPHIICAAYDATLARELAHGGDTNGSKKIGEWAEAHAATAIALDGLDGLPAWGTRDLISQLTERFRAKAASHEGMLELAARHQVECVTLSQRMDEIQRDIAARKTARGH